MDGRIDHANFMNPDTTDTVTIAEVLQQCEEMIALHPEDDKARQKWREIDFAPRAAEALKTAVEYLEALREAYPNTIGSTLDEVRACFTKGV